MSRRRRREPGTVADEKRDQARRAAARRKMEHDLLHEAATEHLALSTAMGEWYDKHLRAWTKAVRAAARAADGLIAGLRDGAIAPPPWPDTAPRSESELEKQHMIVMLEDSVKLRMLADRLLAPFARWAGVKSTRGQRSKSSEASFAEMIRLDKQLASQPGVIRKRDLKTGELTALPASHRPSRTPRTRSGESVSRVFDELTGTARSDGAGGRLRRRHSKKRTQ